MWIKCADQMPEAKMPVLVTFDKRTSSVAEWWPMPLGRWVMADDTYRIGAFTHWQPLN